MIKSNYITDIINLLFDCDKNGLFATQQIPFLTEENFEFTGSGLFVYFDHNTRIEKFKTDNQNLVLDVVTIKSVEHQIEAQAILFFKN